MSDPDPTPLPSPDLDDSEGWVAAHLGGLFTGSARRSRRFTGGQRAADDALSGLDIGGYARNRSAVDPPENRGASGLSPYIRHGLIDLPTVHDHPAVVEASSYDRFRFRGELLWQDYSRQWYAMFGRATRRGVEREPAPGRSAATWSCSPWPDDMRCVEAPLDELRGDGWMVNQTRMWLASQWAVRAGADLRDGDDEMFRHLLDYSRAANRWGWQWVTGGVRARSYGFARRQVAKRAPAYCEVCRLADACPIASYPGSVSGDPVESAPTEFDVAGFGPQTSESQVESDRSAEVVWLTGESLGDADPALRAFPTAAVHFVFDEPLLRSLRLDGKRLVFFADCLADLATRRSLTIWRGRPAAVLRTLTPSGLAVTYAPVPGFVDIVTTTALRDASVQPWRWLRPPTPPLLEHLAQGRFPSFRDWCRLTKPSRSMTAAAAARRE